MNRIVQILVRFFMRWMPDSFVVAVLLTLLTFALAVTVAGYGAAETVQAWGDGFWNLLTFTNQITLTLLFGFALANTRPARALLLRVAGLVRSPSGAYALACLVAGICALLSWGLSLIAAGIMTRAIGESCRKKGIRIHYPLLTASAFSGFVIWHQGLSSSIGLALATPGHFLEAQTGIIGTGETIFSLWNIVVALLVLVTLPFVMARLHPRRDADVSEIPDHLMGQAGGDEDTAATTPAERLEQSRLLNALIVIAGLFVIWTHFITRGEGLTLNIFNFLFLVAGLILAGTAVRYVRIIVDGGRVAAPFLLQYPFYAGIAGVMGASGLAQMVVDLFVRLASASTLPFFAFISGGLLNLFIPSGGGQWAVQGPIMMSAALEIDADLARTAMGVALGDQWTNLVQPLAIIPVLAIAQVPLRAMMGYTFIGLFWSGAVFSVALLFF